MKGDLPVPKVPGAGRMPFTRTGLPKATRPSRRGLKRGTKNSFMPSGSTGGRGGTGTEFDTESYVNGRSKFD